METTTYVFCDWTLLDAIGRFLIFGLWGYFMGKSVTHSKATKWVFTFLGVLFCASIHTWMQAGELNQFSSYSSEQYSPIVETDGSDLIFYFIKVFMFYLTASVIGYRTGLRTAEKIKANLKQMEAFLNRSKKI